MTNSGTEPQSRRTPTKEQKECAHRARVPWLRPDPSQAERVILVPRGVGTYPSGLESLPTLAGRGHAATVPSHHHETTATFNGRFQACKTVLPEGPPAETAPAPGAAATCAVSVRLLLLSGAAVAPRAGGSAQPGAVPGRPAAAGRGPRHPVMVLLQSCQCLNGTCGVGEDDVCACVLSACTCVYMIVHICA